MRSMCKNMTEKPGRNALCYNFSVFFVIGAYFAQSLYNSSRICTIVTYTEYHYVQNKKQQAVK